MFLSVSPSAEVDEPSIEAEGSKAAGPAVPAGIGRFYHVFGINDSAGGNQRLVSNRCTRPAMSRATGEPFPWGAVE